MTQRPARRRRRGGEGGVENDAMRKALQWMQVGTHPDCVKQFEIAYNIASEPTFEAEYGCPYMDTPVASGRPTPDFRVRYPRAGRTVRVDPCGMAWCARARPASAPRRQILIAPLVSLIALELRGAPKPSETKALLLDAAVRGALEPARRAVTRTVGSTDLGRAVTTIDDVQVRAPAA